MFFLLVLNFLAFSVLEISLLENKMVNSYQYKIKSFYVAEKKLLDAEKRISEKKNLDLETIESNICGVNFYRFQIEGDYRGAKTCLQSTFAKKNDIECDIKPNENIFGRQSFLIKECK